MADAIAAGVYWPLARAARSLEHGGVSVELLPLSFDRNSSVYTMRTDAFDRFGTRLEQRFTAQQMQAMMAAAGLERITFQDTPPCWCAIGYRSWQPSET